VIRNFRQSGSNCITLNIGKRLYRVISRSEIPQRDAQIGIPLCFRHSQTLAEAREHLRAYRCRLIHCKEATP
jgi:hypothetical protein